MQRLAAALTLAALGCQPEVVKWEEQRQITTTLPADARLTFNQETPVFAPAQLLPVPVAPSGACLPSIRLARHSGARLHAVWWSLRADSSAALLAARSDNNGVSWTEPVPVDTNDVARLGCARISPAVAVDHVTGYIHIVYSLENATGTGVFFSHSMEDGSLYHAPVALVYGAQTTQADVAAERSRVVVAYEDPNLREQSAGRIALAISWTDGHIFAQRTPVSRGTAAVAAPRVAIAGDRVAVSWVDGGRAIAGEQHRVVRIGQLQAPKHLVTIPPPKADEAHPASHSGAPPAQP